MDLPPPEPTEPDDDEVQRPPICAVPDRPTTRRQAAALERERRELLAKQVAEEEDDDIDIDRPAPDEEVSLKRADLRAIENANLLPYQQSSQGDEAEESGKQKGEKEKYPKVS